MTLRDAPLAKALDPALAWDAVLGAARLDTPPPAAALVAKGLAPVAADDPRALLCLEDGLWRPASGVDGPARELLELYLPLCTPRRPLCFAHLGQSVDGCIAAPSGDSYYVNGRENIVHLHRLRALADAVVVGAGTVAVDDPRLTTRHVRGPSPTRVVIDPRRRLPADRAVFGGGPPTLVACDARQAATRHGHAEALAIPAGPHGLALPALLDALRARGLGRVLVEGGGVTVSRFLRAGLLDRLHLAVAPIMLGGGRRGLEVSPHERLVDYPRPPCRLFLCGADLLYDYDLRAPPAPAGSGDAVPVRIYPP